MSLTLVANVGAWSGLVTQESSSTLTCSSSFMFITLHITSVPLCPQATDVSSSVSTHLNMDNGLIGKTGIVIIQIDVKMCFVVGVITWLFLCNFLCRTSWYGHGRCHRTDGMYSSWCTALFATHTYNNSWRLRSLFLYFFIGHHSSLKWKCSVYVLEKREIDWGELW